MIRNCPFLSHKFSGFFLPKLKIEETEKFWIYVVIFDPIQIQTSLASQNDSQHLSFVKDSYIVPKKLAELVIKWQTHTAVTFICVQTIAVLGIVKQQYIFINRWQQAHDSLQAYIKVLKVRLPNKSTRKMLKSTSELQYNLLQFYSCTKTCVFFCTRKNGRN